MPPVKRRTPARPKARLKPRRQPSQSRSRDTVEVLLKATARVLVRRGWSGTTTNHIAAAAGVSVGTLYEYFPGKDAMVHALVGRHLDLAEDALGTTLGEITAEPEFLTLEHLALSMVHTMVELHAAAPQLHRVLFEEIPHPPVVKQRIEAIEKHAVATLAGVLEQMPEVPTTDHHVAAHLVYDMLESLTHRWVTDAKNKPIAAHQLAGELVRMIVAYLRAPVD